MFASNSNTEVGVVSSDLEQHFGIVFTNYVCCTLYCSEINWPGAFPAQ